MTAFHLCIDMQVANGAIFAPDDWSNLRETIASFTHALEDRGIKTACLAYMPSSRTPIFGKYADYAHYFRRNSSDFWWHNDNIDFRMDPTDLVGIKNTISAYHLLGLRKYLEDNRIRTIILSGVTEGREDHPHPDYCVRATARDFRAHGYEVIIAAEATDAALPGFYSGLTAAKILSKRQQDFRGIGVQVMPIRDVLSRFGALHPYMTGVRGHQPPACSF